jgi:aspartate kinase
MEVFKFGGASVKDASSVKNVVTVLNHTGAEDKVVVVSAMGKMTNAFELVVASYLEKNSIVKEQLSAIKNFHLEIASELFEEAGKGVFHMIEDLFEELTKFPGAQ